MASGSAAWERLQQVVPPIVETDRRHRCRITTALVGACILLALPAICRAATLTVNTTSDTGGSGDGSLRGEILAANPTGDTIQFGVSGTISLGSALIISKSLTINASSAPGPITIDGGGTVQLMQVNSGVTLSLRFLTLAHGSVTTTAPGGNVAGAAISNSGTLNVTNCAFSDNQATGGPGLKNFGAGAGSGGAISNNGMLNITNSTFSGNEAIGGPGSPANPSNGGVANGGAIATSGGTVTITNTTFSLNQANGGAANGSPLANGGSGAGGGIFASNSSVTVMNSTFSGNSTTGGPGSGGGSDAAGFGGGIFASDGGAVVVTNCTFLANSATAGGAIGNDAGSVSLTGTILATSTGGNCSGAVTDGGFNISDDLSNCGFMSSTGANGQTIGAGVSDAALALGTLANNGGPTKTIALLTGSVAIGSIPDTCLPTDQRGFPRPGAPFPNPACDIGAFEFQAPPPSPTLTGTSITPIPGSEGAYHLSYFDVATAFTPSVGLYGGPGNSGGTGDALFHTVNAGNFEGSPGPFATGGGDVCENIYVYNDVQEQMECCSCPLTPNSLLTASVIVNLTANPFNKSESLSAGVIKVVGSEPADAAHCSNTVGHVTAASFTTVAGGLHPWLNHTEKMASNQGGFKPPFGFVTSTSVEEFAHSPLDTGELAYLQAGCAAINAADLAGSSKIGICTCGEGD